MKSVVQPGLIKKVGSQFFRPYLKKFATLLPNNWLAESPQSLALMRLGRQSAERELISEITWNVKKLKRLLFPIRDEKNFYQ
ncbi:hypothetical protein J7J00_09065 [Bacillus sp. ISL-4]|uniref:hypothetical protein n=1 Tax=Bacillus sp. ISL-4 TaxID=2819125 RepID=UPI001BEA847F|nr:hypothetical protein [Bacillus sp. ISL-4]MBT2665646.1 hypothetical protein [Bacillus sp. ISL-4]MBT2671978.1 hypothetical protein [Streptomyces sp. ISL-14]